MSLYSSGLILDICGVVVCDGSEYADISPAPGFGTAAFGAAAAGVGAAGVGAAAFGAAAAGGVSVCLLPIGIGVAGFTP